MLNVQIVLFDGFDLLDAVAPYEVLHAAAMKTDNKLDVQFVSAEGERLVSSNVNGLQLPASYKLDPQQADIIIVPGAAGETDGDTPDSVPATLSRAAQSALTPLMKQALERQNCLVATVCGGSLVLAMGGLLEGRYAVTHYLGMGMLEATGAIPISARIVDDGNLVTGGGVTSGLDVALYIVERKLGARIAHAVEQLFEFERRGTVWSKQGMAPILSNSLTAAVDEKDNLTDAGHAHPAALSPVPSATAVFDGEWDVVIATPVGKLHVRLSIFSMNGEVKGTAAQEDERTDFVDPVIEHHTLSWSLPVTKPLRLNLKFEVKVNGDTMTGIAKVGMLPASKLSGRRIGS